MDGCHTIDRMDTPGMKANTSLARHHCPLCPKQFTHRTLAEVRRLRVHLIEDHNVLDTTGNCCLICRFHYSNIWYIRQHVEKKHFQPPWNYAAKNSDRPTVKCRICTKDISARAIEKHIKVHYTKLSLSCPLNRSAVHLQRYSIYDILGKLGKDYKATKATYSNCITVYEKPGKNISETNKTEEEVINLDSDSDNETSRRTRDEGSGCEGDSSDSDVLLLGEENQIECESKRKIAIETQLSTIEREPPVKLEIKIDSIRSGCKESELVAVRDSDDVAEHEDEDGEDDIVAELEQYIEENEPLV